MHFWGMRQVVTPFPPFSWQEAEQTQAFISSGSPENNLPQ